MTGDKNIPDISVIVLNYNGKHLLKECIDSVLNQTFSDFEIIVVDNGSSDGSAEYLKKIYGSSLNVIELNVNKGFAGGNNAGIEASAGNYIALLNNDAVADPEWLERLINAVKRSDETYGMWASKIMFYNDRNVIDTAGHLIYPDGLNRGRGKGEKDVGQYEMEEEVFFPSGCAALYSKKMINEIGGFDADFFAYGDDTDIGIKARLAGWKCLYVPSAVVYHKSSASFGIYSPLKAYLVERNRIWILIKYFPFPAILLSVFYTFLRYIYQAYGAISGKGASGRFVEGSSRLQLLKVLCRAYIDAFKKLPVILKKRKNLRHLRKASSNDFYTWLRRFRISSREISLRD